MRRLLLLAIRAYQRFASPHKGFSCAYRVHTGRASCSTLGYRAVRRFGAWRGLALIERRTWLCGVAHRRYGRPTPLRFHHQRGDCDPGCDASCVDGCDLPMNSSSGKGVDALSSCCDATPCDSSKKPRKSRRKEEQEVHLPPKADP